MKFLIDMKLSPLWVSFPSNAGFSIIQLRSQEALPAATGDAVVRAIRIALGQLERGALVTADPVPHRVRLLPLP